MAAVVQVLLSLLLAACVLSSPKLSQPNPLINQEEFETSQERENPHEGRKYRETSDVLVNLLNKAVLGIDPFKLDSTVTSDSGVREAIFSPTQYVDFNNVIQNDFITVPRHDVLCQIYLKTKHLVVDQLNFTEYQQFQFPSVEVDSSVKVIDKSNQTVPLNPAVDYINGTNEHKDKVALAFKLNAGEIIMKQAYCMTHVTLLNLKSKPIFTKSFLKALQLLNAAAKQPESESSRVIFGNFVEKFGTHYQSSTHFGSAINYEKLYSSQSKDENERRKRQRCASIAMQYAGTLHSSPSALSGDTSLFETLNDCEIWDDSSDNVNAKLYSTKLVSLGSSGLNAGPLSRPVFPTAIHYKLTTIANIFKEKWFNDLHSEDTEAFDGTAMFHFFENSMIHYCTITLGAPCHVITKPCRNLNACSFLEESGEDSSDAFSEESTCSPDHNRYEEPHSCKGYICVYSGPGNAMIAGGYGRVDLTDTESFPAGARHPPLPAAVYRNTLVIAGDFFYSCGGDGNRATADCYRLHRHETNASWHLAEPLPVATHQHSAVSVGHHNIWYINEDKIHNFDVTTGEYTTTSLPFTAKSDGHCAVSNGNYSYVIGVGDNDDEIWVNTISQHEVSWQKVGNLKQSRKRHACLWYDSNIMITGGFYVLSDVEIFNTETNTIREATPMLVGREHHAMMLHEGYPTVVGGWDHGYLRDDLQPYDIGTERWSMPDIKLEKGKYLFGLVEIEPHLGVRGDGQC